MYKVRIVFSKTGYSKYVSHLDLMKTMQRCFKRGKVDISYSMGYNPHPVMSIAFPLPLGVEGVNEYMDIKTDSEPDTAKIKEKLNLVLPSDIRVKTVSIPNAPLTDICRAEYTIKLFLNQECKNLKSKIAGFMENEHIVIDKKTKRGIAETDIRPMIYSLETVGGNGREPVLKCVLALGEPCNLKVVTMIEALKKYEAGINIEYYAARRERLMTSDLKEIN